MSFDTNDPRLTAYALGELDDTERAKVEALLNESPQARAAVDQIRQTAHLLTRDFANEPAVVLTTEQREVVEAALGESGTGLGAPSESRGAADFSPRGPAQAEACGSSRQALSGALNVPKTGRVRFLRHRWVPYAVAASIVVLVGVPLGSFLLPSLTRTREMARRTAAPDSVRSLRGIGQGTAIYALDGGEWFNPSVTRGAAKPTDELTRSDFAGYTKLSYAYQVPFGRRGQPRDSDADAIVASNEVYFTEVLRRDEYDIAWDAKDELRRIISYEPQNSDAAAIQEAIAEWIEANPELSQEHILVREHAPTLRFWRADPEAALQQLERLVQAQYTENMTDEDRRAIAVLADRMRRYLDATAEAQQPTESYDAVVHNPFLAVMQNPLSTFSIDVDTASYANVRRFLNSGQLPPAGAVRIEEMVNYFDYDYPGPEDTADTAVPHETTAEAAVPHPFSVNVEIGESPWMPEHRLLRVGLKGAEFEPEERPVCNLVFLIDVSGSMSDENKLPLVKEALGLLTEELWDDDRVAMVVYAGASGLALDSTTGRDRDAIFDALARLDAGGSTNGGEGIQLAYALAEEHFIEGGVNRVILATDGDFNVGITDQGDLVRLIEEKAQSGVFLSVLGFGMGNYKDDTLEKLADQGNGNYAYIDTLNEARKVLVDQLSGTLVTIAKDVKIQIEFNPAEVAAYRLIGYENRLLAAQDFNDDTKDAGEIGAGHTVTALYELVPTGMGAPSENGDWLGADSERPDAAPLRSVSEGPSDHEQGEPCLSPLSPPLSPGPHAIAENDALPNIAGDEMVDPLKYQTPGNLAAAALGISDGEVATVKLRYKHPDGDTSQLLEVPVIDDGATLSETSEDFRFAASVASFGMLLRDSPYKAGWTYDAVLELAIESVGADVNGYRAEFVELVEHARELAGQ